MANPQVLLNGLQDYHKELDRHRTILREAYDHVRNVGEQFIAGYDGEAAEQFKAGWARTKRNFDLYLDETSRISAMLAERIEHLGGVVLTEDDLIG
jgi:uncharacterized protein YukE